MKKLMLGVALLGGAACGQPPAKVHVGSTTTTPKGSTSTEAPSTTVAVTTTTEPEPQPVVEAEPTTVYEAPATTRASRPAARATTTVTYEPPAVVERGRSELLECIRSHEQGEDGYATDTGNGFYGAFQFDLPTWRSVGGTGNPADASPAEQDARAWALYQSRGLQPWPTPNRVC